MSPPDRPMRAMRVTAEKVGRSAFGHHARWEITAADDDALVGVHFCVLDEHDRGAPLGEQRRFDCEPQDQFLTPEQQPCN